MYKRLTDLDLEDKRGVGSERTDKGEGVSNRGVLGPLPVLLVRDVHLKGTSRRDGTTYLFRLIDLNKRTTLSLESPRTQGSLQT